MLLFGTVCCVVCASLFSVVGWCFVVCGLLCVVYCVLLMVAMVSVLLSFVACCLLRVVCFVGAGVGCCRLLCLASAVCRWLSFVAALCHVLLL